MNANQTTKAKFANLARLLEIENEKRKEEAAFFIENGFLTHWNETTHQQNDNGIERYSTPRRWEQYKNGEISREKAIEYATRRAHREIDKQTIKKQDKLLKARDADEIKTVSILVEWKRSSVWGYNPTALVTINGKQQFGGTASGCGYDKQTAAVGTALNQSISVLAMLYRAKETALEAAPPEIRNNPESSNSKLIHYGAGYGVLPYFEGGVGMESFRGVFEACGLKLTHENHASRTNDYYYFERV